MNIEQGILIYEEFRNVDFRSIYSILKSSIDIPCSTFKSIFNLILSPSLILLGHFRYKKIKSLFFPYLGQPAGLFLLAYYVRTDRQANVIKLSTLPFLTSPLAQSAAP